MQYLLYWGGGKINAHVFTSGNLRCETTTTGKCRVIGSTTSLTNLVVPDRVSYALTGNTFYCDVEGIGDSAFINQTQLTSIDFSQASSLTYIGQCAFKNTGVSSLNFVGTTVSRVRAQAFNSCTQLTTLNAGTLSTIDSAAFANCTHLSSVVVTSSLNTINAKAFSNCSALTQINIPTSVGTIGDYAFEKTALTSILIPITVNKVPQGLCKECVNLTSVSLPASITEIGQEAFNGCTSLNTISIPVSTTKIGAKAFTKCTALQSISLPNNLAEIGNEAFSYSGITSVSLSNNVTTIPDECFMNCSSLSSITLGNNTQTLSDKAFEGCSSLTSVALPNTIKTIGTRAFYGSGVTNITLPTNNDFTSIGLNVFAHCTHLNSVTIPNNVTYIGKYAFDSCVALQSINLNSVETVDSMAFRNNISLRKLYIPQSLRTIKGEAFDNIAFDTVFCPDTEPADLEETGFSQSSYQNTILAVPTGRGDVYRYATGWRKFQHIEEQNSEDMPDPSALEDVVLQEVLLYPNPAINQITLTLEGMQKANISIYDLQSKRVKELTTKDNVQTIDISGLQQGVYTIVIENNDKKISKKLIVK